VLDAVRKEAPHLPVLIFSTHEGYPKDFRMALVDGFVMKSFCFEKLKQKVAELLMRGKFLSELDSAFEPKLRISV
jgi:DNA-binding NarL/FixJ family response regulator